MDCEQCGFDDNGHSQECWAAQIARLRVELAEAREQIEALRGEWRTAYAAFRGAFDTPVERRKREDEYAQDARDRMRAFDAAIDAARAATECAPAVPPLRAAGEGTEL